MRKRFRVQYEDPYWMLYERVVTIWPFYYWSYRMLSRNRQDVLDTIIKTKRKPTNVEYF